VRLLSVKDVPKNSGANAKYGKTQITVYNFAARGEWYASHAMCPHKNSFVMNQVSRALAVNTVGIISYHHSTSLQAVIEPHALFYILFLYSTSDIGKVFKLS
jgi:nitrite reductase/ring-hydroxylating ferredoxin subunit